MFSANYFGRYISKITNLIVSKINILFIKNEKYKGGLLDE